MYVDKIIEYLFTLWLQVPMAKASIYWLVGEYCSLVPKIAPDVLRKAAKAFPSEVWNYV